MNQTTWCLAAALLALPVATYLIWVWQLKGAAVKNAAVQGGRVVRGLPWIGIGFVVVIVVFLLAAVRFLVDFVGWKATLRWGLEALLGIFFLYVVIRLRKARNGQKTRKRRR